MLTFNYYEHKQLNGNSFFTAKLVTVHKYRFLWFKWTETREQAILLSDGDGVNVSDFYMSRFKTLEEAREACRIYSDSKRNVDNTRVVTKNLVETDTLCGG